MARKFSDLLDGMKDALQRRREDFQDWRRDRRDRKNDKRPEQAAPEQEPADPMAEAVAKGLLLRQQRDAAAAKEAQSFRNAPKRLGRAFIGDFHTGEGLLAGLAHRGGVGLAVGAGVVALGGGSVLAVGAAAALDYGTGRSEVIKIMAGTLGDVVRSMWKGSGLDQLWTAGLALGNFMSELLAGKGGGGRGLSPTDIEAISR